MTPQETTWLALSQLFLDTDVSRFRDPLVAQLRAAPFDLPTLDRMFIDAVYPVCVANLQGVAGAWDGFEEQWLFDAIRQERAKWRPLRGLTRRLRQRRARALAPEWFIIRAALVAAGKE